MIKSKVPTFHHISILGHEAYHKWRPGVFGIRHQNCEEEGDGLARNSCNMRLFGFLFQLTTLGCHPKGG